MVVSLFLCNNVSQCVQKKCNRRQASECLAGSSVIWENIPNRSGVHLNPSRSLLAVVVLVAVMAEM